MPRDPLEQNFLVIQSNHQLYLVPVQDFYEFIKEEDKNKTVESSSLLPGVKMELADESVESEETCKDGKDKVNLVSEIHNENLRHTCPYCWRKFDENWNLKAHMIVHSNVYPYECTICGLRLKTKRLLKSHVSLHKSDIDLFHCAECDFKSAKALSFKCHQIKCHANTYKCQFCFILFQNKAVFLKHMELHIAVTACDVCEDNCHFMQHKSEHQDDNNYNHKQLQHEDECQNDKKHVTIKKCENFDLQEYNNRNLNRLNHDLSLLKEKKVFKCSQCRWSFKTIHLLNKHTKRHSRSFKCHECNAVFKYKASFLNHKYKHKNKY